MKTFTVSSYIKMNHTVTKQSVSVKAPFAHFKHHYEHQHHHHHRNHSYCCWFLCLYFVIFCIQRYQRTIIYIRLFYTTNLVVLHAQIVHLMNNFRTSFFVFFFIFYYSLILLLDKWNLFQFDCIFILIASYVCSNVICKLY